MMHVGKRISVYAIQINVRYLLLNQHTRVWCGCIDANTTAYSQNFLWNENAFRYTKYSSRVSDQTL